MKKIIFPLGIISVATYVLTAIIAGFYKADYSQIWNTVSILAAKGEPTRPTIVASFVFTYLSLGIISVYSYIISKKKISKSASLLLLIVAVFTLVQLFLPMDSWSEVRTSADKIHDWITVGIALSIISSTFFFGLNSKGLFRRACFWASGLITFFSISAGWFLLTWRFNLLGLFERLWILSFLIWIVYFCYILSKENYEVDSNKKN